MQTSIDQLRDHVIVCGHGRFGHIIVEELLRAGTSVVIVERDPMRTPELYRSGAPYIVGSATASDVLGRAGVERARAIVVATGAAADNVAITVAAREANPNIRIHARSESDTVARRLRHAGAHQVISLYRMGAEHAAAAILRQAPPRHDA